MIPSFFIDPVVLLIFRVEAACQEAKRILFVSCQTVTFEMSLNVRVVLPHPQNNSTDFPTKQTTFFKLK